MVGNGVHDRVRPELEKGGRRLEVPAHAGQVGVLAVTDCHDEVRSDEDHDLAGFDDLARAARRIVFHIFHGLEDQEQHGVVPLQLGPLVCVYRVLDSQVVQTEHVRNRLHLTLVGFVQCHPDERVSAVGLDLAHLLQCGGRGESTGQPGAISVDAAVADGRRHRGSLVPAGAACAAARADEGRCVRTEGRHVVSPFDAAHPGGTALIARTSAAVARSPRGNLSM